MNTGSIEMEQLSVSPCIIDVTDVKQFSEVGAGVDIKPAYYNVILRVSPLVIMKLLKWLLANHYIKLVGTLTISIRGRTTRYGW